MDAKGPFGDNVFKNPARYTLLLTGRWAYNFKLRGRDYNRKFTAILANGRKSYSKEGVKPIEKRSVTARYHGN